MADTKISALTELAVPPDPIDELVIVDKSDTTMAASGTDKRIKAQTFLPTVVRKSATETVNNSSTLQNDDHLLWTVAANDVWFFEMWLLVNAATTTPDFKAGWSVPSGTTMKWGATATAGATTPGGFGVITTSGTPGSLLAAAGTLSVGTANSAAVDTGVGFAGFVTVSSTSGTVNFQWAQDTANVSDLKLLINSFMVLRKLV